ADPATLPRPETSPAPVGVAPPPFPVVTVAGIGKPAFSGDGGPATAAALNRPYGPAFDAAGNMYIPDFDNHRVRRISPDGVITTIAGTGEPGFSGDGGPATEAQLRNPTAVAVDDDGLIYIADTFNHRIRRVDHAGIITTIAGSGEPVYNPDQEGGPATAGSMWYPADIAIDPAGSIFIADLGNDRVHRVSVDGTITTLAGRFGEGSWGDGGPAAEAMLDGPFSVAADRNGQIYIAESDGHRVRRIGVDGVIQTIAGTGAPGFSGDGGPATEAMLREPRGVAVDDAGNVYITDGGNNRIRRVDPNGVITTIAGTAPPGAVDPNKPDPSTLYPDGAAAVDRAGNVYVADRINHVIARIELGG
ncbi:MAG: serine/threonine protein kinase, partial [Frankia sp.]|nr:serine/threonine protein kinase [Frankia sp.]